VQLYKDAGVPTKSFMGVPVFQAEGLTVTTQDMVRICRQLHVQVAWRTFSLALMPANAAGAKADVGCSVVC
jgi:hypothetical protein